jgi:hypothetical protein
LIYNDEGGFVVMKPRQTDKRLVKEPERLAKEQARKKASFDREQAIEEAQEARKLKAKEQSPE